MQVRWCRRRRAARRPGWAGALARSARRTAALLLCLAGPQAQAETFTQSGLSFSDERGGFRILGVSGHASLDDPIVVVEEVTDPGTAVLVVRGLGPALGNRIRTAHPAGFALRKIVINGTRESWTIYDIELQIALGTSSDRFDGLSFGQGVQVLRPFSSSVFGMNLSQEEPRDALLFYDGLVRPGEQVAMDFVITATRAVPEFFLVQQQDRPLAGTLSGEAWP